MSGLPKAKVYAVLRSPLLASQKLIILFLEAIERPVSEREIMEILGLPWPTCRGTVARQMAYLLRKGTVTKDKSRMPHLYSLVRGDSSKFSTGVIQTPPSNQVESGL